ncbi:MAG: hypothetical protein IPG23_09640 [Burkholderiales bacterium]|jgi:colicin import membrane protein|nr:hypothetical protein [Burkholderiales bacterium]
MSKVYAFVVACLMLASTAWGQFSSAQQTDDVAEQRERIEAARQQKTMELDAKAAACWSKFAVTDCQNQVKTQRRAMLADFRRQEIRLNDQERQQRAAQQVQRNRERAAEWAERQTGNRSLTEANADSPDQRQERLNEKAMNHQQRAKAVAPVVPVSKAPSGPDAQAVVRNRDAYAEKLRAAEQRRQERERRLLEKANSSVPLPATPP